MHILYVLLEKVFAIEDPLSLILRQANLDVVLVEVVHVVDNFGAEDALCTCHDCAVKCTDPTGTTEAVNSRLMSPPKVRIFEGL